MLRTRTLLVLSTSVLSSALLFGCGDDATTDPSDGGGDGSTTGGRAGTGGSGADGNSGGSGGTNPGSGGGDPGPQVPGTEKYNCSPASGTLPPLKLEPIAGDFARALLVTHAPGETNRLFVIQQNGEIWIVNKSGSGPAATYEKAASIFLDLKPEVQDDVEGDSEQGLLGLAFHPDFATNRLLYVHFSAADSLEDSAAGDTIIEEYKASADGTMADKTSARRVLHVPQPAGNHNGGTLTFGPDGFLYIALGDGGGGDDTYGNGQKVTDLLGNILRIDPLATNDAPYSSPSGNLKDTNAAAAPEVWSYGLRNPFRINFDGCTGDLYIGDVGQNALEEINLLPLGEGLKNYGWPITEGTACLGGGNACDKTGLTPPIATLATASSSIVGGSVYRGADIPALRGTYFYGKTSSGSVYTLTYDGSTVSTPEDRTADVNPDGGYQITSIQNGGDGELYFTALFGSDLLKLVAE